ncbi:hypothetical protein UY3_15044 [Chelonia mydas]|uniref:Uncharacterized protein n=1 Tax=Chelonia mydas TaxID=8469 RepID=M7BI08_CHEMY|nr:hypothetical protein UY3_15044 [Chelonia mydas]
MTLSLKHEALMLGLETAAQVTGQAQGVGWAPSPDSSTLPYWAIVLICLAALTLLSCCFLWLHRKEDKSHSIAVPVSSCMSAPATSTTTPANLTKTPLTVTDGPTATVQVTDSRVAPNEVTITTQMPLAITANTTALGTSNFAVSPPATLPHPP